jgi:CheY-like chemotaxis protein
MLIMRSMEDQALPCDVHHVTDGEAALDYLFHRGVYRNPANPPRPSLVLLDLRMPKVDGLTVLESIMSDRHLCTIPVVVLTSSETDSDIAKAYERRANSYLVKPGSYGAFLELTRSVHQYWLTLNRCAMAAPGSAS